MPYIKDILIDVITDVGVSESSTTTDHALEDGEQISDHVHSAPITLSLSGTLYGDHEQKVLKLREFREKGVIFNFDYMTNYGNVVITDFSRDYTSSVKDGFNFTMSLKQIKLAKVAKSVVVKMSVKKQTKKTTKKGLKQKKKTTKAVAKTTQKKYQTPGIIGQAALDRSKYFDRPNFGYGGQSGLEGRK